MSYIELQQVDNGVFERMRLVLVEEGYLPDVTTITDEAGWTSALEAIKTAGKTPIALYGVGGWKGRGEKLTNAIIIDRTARNLSGLGYDGGLTYTPNGDGFDVHQAPLETATLNYSITVVGTLQSDEYLFQRLMYKAFGVLCQLSGYTEEGVPTDANFIFRREAISAQNGEDFVETVYTYITHELQLEPSHLVGTVSPIQNFNLDSQL